MVILKYFSLSLYRKKEVTDALPKEGLIFQY